VNSHCIFTAINECGSKSRALVEYMFEKLSQEDRVPTLNEDMLVAAIKAPLAEKLIRILSKYTDLATWLKIPRVVESAFANTKLDSETLQRLFKMTYTQVQDLRTTEVVVMAMVKNSNDDKSLKRTLLSLGPSLKFTSNILNTSLIRRGWNFSSPFPAIISILESNGLSILQRKLLDKIAAEVPSRAAGPASMIGDHPGKKEAVTMTDEPEDTASYVGSNEQDSDGRIPSKGLENLWLNRAMTM
jgi:hypothetical protein